jgi:signal transduction histidine kinase
MVNQLLNTSQQSAILDYVIWIVLFTVVFALIYFIFLQIHHSKELKSELAELAKMQKHNVEYEFVLKAMRLSIWHINPKTKEVTYEQDFRDKSGDIVALANGEKYNDSVSMLDPRDASRVMKSMEAICNGETNDYHEIYRISTPYSTKPFYWEESYATVADRDVNGLPTVIVGTSMRVDKRKEMEEALVQARNRAEESDRLKSAFIANMSHEIRTPLNAIVGFTSILPDINDDAERKGLLDLVHENTQKLLRIIDDVVNIAKVEAGQEELVLTAFDLNQALTEQMDRYANDVNPEVKITTQFAESQQSITTDHNRFVEIVKHLLSNAIKFTMKGSITIGYDQPASGRVRVWVRDTGKGIAEEHQGRIFERFFKVDEFIPGAGLGLSVCHAMVQSLGGEMGVESKLGEGSNFWFEIPIQ